MRQLYSYCVKKGLFNELICAYTSWEEIEYQMMMNWVVV